MKKVVILGLAFYQWLKRKMKIATFVAAMLAVAISCDDFPHKSPHGENPGSLNLTKKYPADVAIQWINLQQHLTKTTSGFDPLVASRAFAYSGLALYESVVKGMPGYRSVVSPRIGTNINNIPDKQHIHWAASANAAMACILKNLYGNTSQANQQSIDSLEAALHSVYQSQSNAQIAGQSADYGRGIATKIFEWSKTDGGHEAYLKATSDTYVPPTGPGKWIPTSPASPKPIRPYWGDNRSFVENSANATMPPPPPAYSEENGSVFYNMAKELYDISLTLTEEQIKIAKHWADLPGNYGTPGHYTHIATQLITKNNYKLDDAVMVYAKHGIAINEALICVFKAKYTYNLIRPMSYIRNVMGHSEWNTVVGTPPHPEYPSAHSVIGGASSTVLASFFGKNHSFVDRTHENLYGARTYSSPKAYAEEAGLSRVLGGIHYKISAEVGLAQGEKVGRLINNVSFKGHGSN